MAVPFFIKILMFGPREDHKMAKIKTDTFFQELFSKRTMYFVIFLLLCTLPSIIFFNFFFTFYFLPDCGVWQGQKGVAKFPKIFKFLFISFEI